MADANEPAADAMRPSGCVARAGRARRSCSAAGVTALLRLVADRSSLYERHRGRARAGRAPGRVASAVGATWAVAAAPFVPLVVNAVAAVVT